MAVAKSLRAILEGSPVDPQHRVVNAELRAKLEEMEVQAALNGTLYFEDTLAQLNAISSPATGSTGFVLDNGGNNGVYLRGASSWAKTAELPAGFTDAVGALAAVAAEEVAREAADNLGDIVGLISIGGTGDAITANIPASQAHITLAVGSRVQWRQASSNTGAATITIGGVTYAILTRTGDALAASELVATARYLGVIHAADQIRLMVPVRPGDVGAAPAAHTQAISTVTGLQGALDGKATTAQGAKADTAVQPAALTAARNTDAIIRFQAADMSGTGDAAVGTVTAAQSGITIANDTRIQARWPGTSTIAAPTFTIGATEYTVKSRLNAALPVGALVSGRVYDFVRLTGSPGVLLLMGSVSKTDVGLDSVDNTSDVNKPISTAQQAALDAEATTRNLDDALIGYARPGEAPSLYRREITGAASTGTPYGPSDVIVDADLGACIRISTETYVARRAPVALRPGCVLRARWGIKRTTDSADPLGAAVQCGIRCLSSSKGGVGGGSGTPLAASVALPVSDGVRYFEATIALDVPGVDFTAPSNTRYVDPFVRTFAVDHVTLVGLIDIIDVTDIWEAALPSLEAAEAAGAAAGEAAAEALVGSGNGQFADGTAAAPSVTYAGDTDSGMFRGGADMLGWATGGVARMLLSSTWLNLSVPITGVASYAFVPFANRAALVTAWATRPAAITQMTCYAGVFPEVNLIVIGFAYSDGATAIADMPDAIPVGILTPMHFGADRASSGSDDAAMRALFSYALSRQYMAQIYLPAGRYRVNSALVLQPSDQGETETLEALIIYGDGSRDGHGTDLRFDYADAGSNAFTILSGFQIEFRDMMISGEGAKNILVDINALDTPGFASHLVAFTNIQFRNFATCTTAVVRTANGKTTEFNRTYFGVQTPGDTSLLIGGNEADDSAKNHNGASYSTTLRGCYIFGVIRYRNWLGGGVFDSTFIEGHDSTIRPEGDGRINGVDLMRNFFAGETDASTPVIEIAACADASGRIGTGAVRVAGNRFRDARKAIKVDGDGPVIIGPNSYELCDAGDVAVEIAATAKNVVVEKQDDGLLIAAGGSTIVDLRHVFGTDQPTGNLDKSIAVNYVLQADDATISANNTNQVVIETPAQKFRGGLYRVRVCVPVRCTHATVDLTFAVLVRFSRSGGDVNLGMFGNARAPNTGAVYTGTAAQGMFYMERVVYLPASAISGAASDKIRVLVRNTSAGGVSTGFVDGGTSMLTDSQAAWLQVEEFTG